MAATLPSLRVVVDDVTSRISLDSIGGSPSAPVLSLALGLKINLVELVSMIADYQATYESKDAGAKILAGRALEVIKPLATGPAVPAAAAATPAGVPGIVPAAAPAAPAAPAAAPADTQSSAAATAPQDSDSSSLSNLLAAQKVKVPDMSWDGDISELQPTHGDYLTRTKWTSEGAASSSEPWQFCDESALRDYDPCPLERPRWHANGRDPSEYKETKRLSRSPSPFQPRSSASDGGGTVDSSAPCTASNDEPKEPAQAQQPQQQRQPASAPPGAGDSRSSASPSSTGASRGAQAQTAPDGSGLGGAAPGSAPPPPPPPGLQLSAGAPGIDGPRTAARPGDQQQQEQCQQQ